MSNLMSNLRPQILMSQIKTGIDVERLRADFPILQQTVHGKQLVYLDNAATTQRPRSVIEAISKCYERDYSNVHRGVHAISERATALYEDARRNVQEFINAKFPEEIIFTSGTTAAINLVARSYGDAFLKQGDEILLTQMEHHSNIVPWQQLAARSGAVVRFAPITDDGLIDTGQFQAMLNGRTKIVAVTAVSNVLGTINPIEQLTKMAHAVGAKILVDAAQSVPHEPQDVRLVDADFFCFSGHKMLGPSGVGVLFAKRELLEIMPPFLGGGSMIRTVSEEGYTPGDLPAKFEAGTPPIVPAIALTAAIEYLNTVGMESIREHELQLTRRAHDVLADIAGLRILGPAPEDKGGIVSFVVDKVNVQDIATFMDLQGVAIRPGHHCAMPLHKRYGVPASNRASFYLYNTLEEVELLGQSLSQVLKKLR